MVTALPSTEPEAASADRDPIAGLAPAPDGGALVLEVECRTSPHAHKGDLHEVTIEPDWSVTTPHDLESERVAAAFGGYTSCLVLVDRTIPAFRESLALLTRRARPALRRNHTGAWLLPSAQQLERCCDKARFSTAEKAVRHLRSVEHLALERDVPEWQLRQVYGSAQRTWGSWEGRPNVGHEVSSLVREVGGVTELWRSGIRPDEIVDLAGQVDMVTEALPIAYFLGMVYGDGDPEWMRAILRHRPDPDVAAWLAGLDKADQRGDGDTWGRWLAYGLPKNDARTLVEDGISPDLVEQIARATGWRHQTIAVNLVVWVRAGCHPGVEEFALLARHGIRDPRFTREVLDEIIAEIGSLVQAGLWSPVALSPSEVAVMYAALGNRADVINAVHAGVRGVDGLDGYLAELRS